MNKPDRDSILQYLAATAVNGAPFTAASRVGGRTPTPTRGRPDNVLRGDSLKALQGITTTTGECAEDIDHEPGTPCASRKMARAVVEFAAVHKNAGPEARHELLPSANSAEAAAVRVAAAVLGCDSESCVVSHPSLRAFVVERKLMAATALDLELDLRYKEGGPRDSLGLLSNFDIDGTLRRWARVFPELYPCPFAMMDFDRNGDHFGVVSMRDMLDGNVSADLGPGIGRVRRKFSCFGCVVNTDTSSGPGKHWVAVFVDCRGGPGDTWTVEYFNSAGNPPPKPMVKWMERTRELLERYRNNSGPVESVSVTDMDHQESQTECGLYALFYIRRRIEGVPYTFFLEQLIPDDAMTTFRTHVFRRTK